MYLTGTSVSTNFMLWQVKPHCTVHENVPIKQNCYFQTQHFDVLVEVR